LGYGWLWSKYWFQWDAKVEEVLEVGSLMGYGISSSSGLSMVQLAVSQNPNALVILAMVFLREDLDKDVADEDRFT
jgi:hypothetical protein